MSGMLALPEDCIAAVISFTSPRDACHLACVSTTFRSAADSDIVWDRFLLTEYLSAISDPGPVSSLSKKELYIRSHYIPILNGKLDRTEKEVAAAAAKEAYEQLKAGIEIKLAAASNSRKAAKKAANEAYEDLNAVEENDVVVSNSGKERDAEAEYPENAPEATLRMLAKKVASENNNTKRRESESHCDNNGNKRRQESQDTFEIGELELEGYFDNGASVQRRRRGIWKPNGLRKCSRKLS
ncbi:hypothetical protein LWI29_004979 [Acer saccharum]|uniref:F-box domain-containing protein n=1 Tax=Acer saccharum TaxID=4024 RepID=A0AA39W8V1_ACESA|nr:hypothetical protein LWI29_004979 [Acer saccharum]